MTEFGPDGVDETGLETTGFVVFGLGTAGRAPVGFEAAGRDLDGSVTAGLDAADLLDSPSPVEGVPEACMPTSRNNCDVPVRLGFLFLETPLGLA